MAAFDKVRFFSNLYWLIKEKGKKLGELEKLAGVSVGYFSRINKEGSNAIPSIEVVTALASELGVAIDTLVFGNFCEPTVTEEYLIDFLEKLLLDTQTDSIIWEKEGKAYLSNRAFRDREITYPHPLFAVSYDDKKGYCYRSRFHNSKDEVGVIDDCYHVPLGDGNTVYLMCVGSIDDTSTSLSNQIREYELYIVSKELEVSNVCHSLGQDTDVLWEHLQRLYDAAIEQCHHTQIAPEVRSIIDAYMNPKPKVVAAASKKPEKGILKTTYLDELLSDG